MHWPKAFLELIESVRILQGTALLELNKQRLPHVPGWAGLT